MSFLNRTLLRRKHSGSAASPSHYPSPSGSVQERASSDAVTSANTTTNTPASKNGTPVMHRRAAAGVGGGTAHHILPVTVHDDHNNRGSSMLSGTTSTTRRKPVVGANNNFLLGGMYVPGKDKRKRPRQWHHHHRYRFRITNQIMDLWWRLWYTSPAVALIGGFVVFFVLLCYLLFPLVGWMLFGGSTSTTTWSLSHRGMDWLLTDTTLLLVTPQEERVAAEQLAVARKQQQQSTRLQQLESLASGWYHRNDPAQLAHHPGLVRHEYEGGTTTMGGAKKGPVPTARTTNSNRSQQEPTHPNADKDARRNVIVKDRPVLRTLHTMEQLADNSHCTGYVVETDIRTTLVLQSSLDRIWVLEETCLRWTDPIVAVVAVRDKEQQREEAHNLTAAWTETCPQLSFIVYQLDRETEDTPEQYPVNVLRNLGLDEVRTSHVLMVDVDFVPSRNLHETIRSVLLHQQNANNTTFDRQAIVVPAFARVLDPPCTTDATCRQHLRHNSSFIPHTFDDLQHCHRNRDCIVFQSDVNWPGHASTRSYDWLKKQWYETDGNNDEGTSSSSTIRRIPCFETLRYEPYVVIRWCPSGVAASTTRPVAPYYDERFHGYGKNKIEYIAHLRLLGYQFRVLPEGFMVHNPHVESAVKDAWNNVAESDLHRTMDRLYQTFVGELVDKYYDQYKDDIVQSCPPPEKV